LKIVDGLKTGPCKKRGGWSREFEEDVMKDMVVKISLALICISLVFIIFMFRYSYKHDSMNSWVKIDRWKGKIHRVVPGWEKDYYSEEILRNSVKNK
jgi:hypothetical protein